MIVITGGAGFIGSVLAARFNELGEKGLAIVDQKAQGSFKWKNVEKRAFELYAESDEFLERLEKGEWNGRVRAVFHMGACSDTTEMNVPFLKRNNTEYTQRLALWCLRNNVYFAYASSAATYGDGSLGFSDDDALTPRLEPLNPYGRSKLEFDAWAIEQGHHRRITGFRFFNVYGPNEYHKGAMRSMAHKGFEQVMATGALKLFKSYRPEYPDGGQMRDFVYVKDVVEAMLWFYRNPLVKGIFNLGAGKAESWNALAEAIFKACGKPKRVEYIDMPDSIRGQYQYFTEADLTKLRKAGCPSMFLDAEHGVADYVHNYLATKDPYL